MSTDLRPASTATPLPRPPGLTTTLAELRTRMGADLVWFGRIGEVTSEPGQARGLWWSGCWAPGNRAAADALSSMDDQPVARGFCLDLTPPPLKWQTRTYRPGEKGFWSCDFARNAYLRHDLQEEHRLVVRDEIGVLGVLAAVWDRRRTGVGARLSRALRDGHARWAHERVRQAFRYETAVDAAASGHLIVAPADGIQFATAPAHAWLDDRRAERLVAGVTRFVQAQSPRPTRIAVAGAEVWLNPMRGPRGAAWLVELHPLARSKPATQPLLTPAQAAVVDWVLRGCTAAEIAHKLDKGVETVRSQIKQAYGRLGVTNRLELARAMSSSADSGLGLHA